MGNTEVKTPRAGGRSFSDPDVHVSFLLIFATIIRKWRLFIIYNDIKLFFGNYRLILTLVCNLNSFCS